MEEGSGDKVTNGVHTAADDENGEQELRGEDSPVGIAPLKMEVLLEERGEDCAEEEQGAVDISLPDKDLHPPNQDQLLSENIIKCLVDNCTVTFAKINHMHRHVTYVHKKDPRKLMAEEENKIKRKTAANKDKEPGGSESEDDDDGEEEIDGTPLCVFCCYSFVPSPLAPPPSDQGGDGEIQQAVKNEKEEKLYKNPQFKAFVNQIVKDREGFRPELLTPRILKCLSICPDCQKMTRIAMERQAAMKAEEDRLNKLHQKLIRKIRKLPKGLADYRNEIKKMEDIVSGSDTFSLEADLERKKQMAKQSGNVTLDGKLVMMLRDGIVSTANDMENMLKKNKHLGLQLAAVEDESSLESAESEESSSESDLEEEKDWELFRKKLYEACGTGNVFPHLQYNSKTDKFSLGPIKLIVHEESETLECSKCSYRATETPHFDSKVRPIKAWQLMQKHVNVEHLNVLLGTQTHSARRRKRYRQSSDSESDKSDGDRKKRKLRARTTKPKYLVEDAGSDEDEEESDQENKKDNENSGEDSDGSKERSRKRTEEEKKLENKSDKLNGSEKSIQKPEVLPLGEQETTQTTEEKNMETSKDKDSEYSEDNKSKKLEDEDNASKDKSNSRIAKSSTKKTEASGDSSSDEQPLAVRMQKRNSQRTEEKKTEIGKDEDSNDNKRRKSARNASKIAASPDSKKGRLSRKREASTDESDSEEENVRGRRIRRPARYSDGAGGRKRATTRNAKNVKYKETDSDDDSSDMSD